MCGVAQRDDNERRLDGGVVLGEMAATWVLRMCGIVGRGSREGEKALRYSMEVFLELVGAGKIDKNEWLEIKDI